MEATVNTRTMSIVTGLALALAAGLVSSAAGAWVQQSSPTTSALYGVAASDSATWVAVGDVGAIVRSTDGGVTWNPVSSPLADAIRAVTFRGTTGIMAGVGGRIARSTDAGLTWNVVARPTTKILWAAAAGDSGFIVTGEEGRILVSTDDGLTWSTHFAGTISSFFGVSVQGGVGVAAGGAGNVAFGASNGVGWGLTVLGAQNTFYYAVSMVTPRTGWIAGTDPSGAGQILRTDLSGVTWTLQPSPGTGILFGLSFSAPDTGTAVGELGAIVHTDDGGTHWLPQHSGTTATLNAVHFVTPGLGIAVGGGGVILRSSAQDLAAVDPGVSAGARLALHVLDSRGTGGAARFAADLPSAARVELRVLDVAGRSVATLAAGDLPAGTHEFAWDGRGVDGSAARAGVYFAQLRTADGEAHAKFLRLR
jgi:photosystem II stability/assembly factor-like uncharacterized protein